MTTTTVTISEGIQTDRITILDNEVVDILIVSRAGTITVSAVAPSDPEVGDLWVETN